MRVAAFGEQRGVRGERNDIGVALKAGEIGRLGQRGTQRGAPPVVMRGVFTDIDLRIGPVVVVIAPEVVPEPMRRHVVVLVHHWNAQLVGDLPAVVEIFSAVRRPHGANDGDLGVLRLHRVVNHFEPLEEDRRDAVLVADAEVFQVERLGMAGGGPHGAPSGRRRSVRPLDEIEHLLDVIGHGVERQPALARAALMIGVLATHARRHDGDRLRANVLTKLEILEIAQPNGLMITPDVRLAATLFDASDGVLPAIQVAEAVTMHEATTGKAQELRL